jgi:hypothetical protein
MKQIVYITLWNGGYCSGIDTKHHVPDWHDELAAKIVPFLQGVSSSIVD